MDDPPIFALNKNLWSYVIHVGELDPIDTSYLKSTCKTLYKRVVDKRIQEYRTDPLTILCLAARDGFLRIVKKLYIENHTYKIHVEAAFNGHLHIIEWLNSEGHINFYDDIVRYACAGGHVNVAEWATAQGGLFCFDWALHWACEHGQLEAAKWCAKQGVDDWDDALECAVSSGNTEIVKFCIENGASRMGLISTQNMEINQLLVEHELNDILSIACFAYSQNEIALAQWCYQYDPSFLDKDQSNEFSEFFTKNKRVKNTDITTY